MRIETLGAPRLITESHTVGPDHEVVLALVLALLESPVRRVSRAALHELLWPRVARERASHNLRQATYKLKRFGLTLDSSGDDLALPGGCTWDLEERLALETAAPDLTQKWTFLAGYEPHFSPAWAARVERWRERVHRRLTERLMQGLRQSRMRTQWVRAVAFSQAILEIDPLNEEATLTFAEGRALQGSKAEAVAMLDRYLEEIDGKPGELAIQPTLLRRRITERMPAAARDRADWKLLVGRDALLESFASHMRRARESTGTIVAMWGEPGVGKTRMVRELNALAAVEGWSLVTISCEPTWPDRPLCALEVMTSTMLLQPGALGVDPKAHRALQRLTRMDADDEPLPQGPEDSAYRQRLLRTSVLDLIDAVSSERPLLIAIDDSQWLDPTSVPFFSMAVEHAASRRVAWVFTAHQREQLPKMATGGSRALVARVNPLTEDESFELLGALVHGQPPADRPALLRRAASVSNGNPLYVHTLATHWLSTGDLSELPPSLEALIEQRLDTLTATGMRCLQICALLGRHATLERVEEVLRVERGALLEAMDALHSAGLLETDADAPLVRHGIIAVRSVGRASRATVVLLHRYIADVLEPVAVQGTDAALLVAYAEHLKAANLEQRGLDNIERTVRRLVRAGLLEAASTILDELRESETLDLSDDLGARLRAELLLARGENHAASVIAEGYLAALPPDRQNEPGALAVRAVALHGRLNRFDASPGIASRAVALARECGRFPNVFPRAILRAFVAADSMFDRLAFEQCCSILEEVSTSHPTEPLHRGHLIRFVTTGRLNEARALAGELAAKALTQDGPLGVSSAYSDMCQVFRAFGETSAAADCIESALRALGDAGNIPQAVHFLNQLFHVRVDQGDTRGAVATVERGLAMAARSNDSAVAGMLRQQIVVLRAFRLAGTEDLEALANALPASIRATTTRFVAFETACQVLEATNAGVDPASEEFPVELDTAVSFMRQALGWPRVDLVISAVASSLLRLDRRQEACSYLSEHLERRAERGPLPALLDLTRVSLGLEVPVGANAAD